MVKFLMFDLWKRVDLSRFIFIVVRIRQIAIFSRGYEYRVRRRDVHDMKNATARRTCTYLVARSCAWARVEKCFIVNGRIFELGGTLRSNEKDVMIIVNYYYYY